MISPSVQKILRIIYWITVISAFLFVVSSCKSPKPTLQESVIKTDSTVTTVNYVKKTDTIKIAPDSLKFSVPLPRITEIPIYYKSETGHITGSVKKIDENIEIECYVDELIKIIESQNQIITTLTKQTEAKQKTITNTEYKTHWFYKLLSIIGGIALLFFGFKIAL